MANEKLYSPDEARDVLMKATKEKLDGFAREIEGLKARELKKALIPNHKHNPGVEAGAGVEDVPPGKTTKGSMGTGLDGSMGSGAAPMMNDLDKGELCKKCGKGHKALDKCMGKYDEMDKAVDKIVVHKPERSPKPVPPDADHTVRKEKDKVIYEAKKTELVDAKGKRTTSGIHPDSTLPEDKKPELVNKPGKTPEKAGSGGAIIKGKEIKKAERHDFSAKSTGPGSSCSICGKGRVGHEERGYETAETKARRDAEPDSDKKGPKIKKADPLSHPDLLSLPKDGEKKDPKKPEPVKKAATPPMAKPPSGQNMGTSVPTSAPKAPKAPMMKGVMNDVVQRESAQMGAPAPKPAGPAKMPTPEQHAGRAAHFADAMGGAFQPKPAPLAAPKPALRLKSPKAAGVTAGPAAAPKPVMNAARPAKPGIFAKLANKFKG